MVVPAENLLAISLGEWFREVFLVGDSGWRLCLRCVDGMLCGLELGFRGAAMTGCGF